MPLEISSFIPSHVMAHLPSPVKQVIDYSQSTLTGLEREVERVKTQATDIFQAFQRSPMEGAQRVWTQLTQNPENVSSTIGLAFQMITFIGIVFRNTISLTFGLIGSSAAHVVSSDSIQKKAELKRHNEALEIANTNLKSFVDDLVKAKVSLEAQIHFLQRETKSFTIGNIQPQKSISDLQLCIIQLNEFRASLDQKLARLSERLDEFQKENERLGVKIESITGIENSVLNFKAFFDAFSRYLAEANVLFTAQLKEISDRMNLLSDTVHTIAEREHDLVRIPPSFLVYEQFTIALNEIIQYQERLIAIKTELEATHKKTSETKIKMETLQRAFEALLGKFE